MRGKILVVDDDPVIRRMLTLVLRKEGYDVTTAMDGEEALTQIRGLEPPLVFMDAMMPRKGGYQTCQEVRDDPTLMRQPYIIMLTARGQEADREKAERVGVNDFMTKPFSPSKVVARVREILGQS